MDTSAILAKLQSQFAGRTFAGQLEVIDPWIEVESALLAEVALFLRDDAELRFDLLHCITGVDYLQVDPKRKAEFQPHVELIYHLSSMTHRHRLVLKVLLPRWKDDRAGQLPEVATVSAIWPTADWHEREVYDLTGIHFLGHPDLRRILCPEDWAGHPLRKDYEMPLEYHGIRGR